MNRDGGEYVMNMNSDLISYESCNLSTIEIIFEIECRKRMEVLRINFSPIILHYSLLYNYIKEIVKGLLTKYENVETFVSKIDRKVKIASCILINLFSVHKFR